MTNHNFLRFILSSAELLDRKFTIILYILLHGTANGGCFKTKLSATASVSLKKYCKKVKLNISQAR
jgi:hypothetical protein